jgi:5-methylthioadenosine/S-adenosylhomocysteine deaminase
MPVESRAPKRNAKMSTWSRLRPASPALLMPMPTAAVTARSHSNGERDGNGQLSYPVVMTSCDVLLTNAAVLTMDDGFTIHPSGSVAIAGDTIVAVFPDGPRIEAAEVVDCGGKVVMPGLVNAHTHAPMTLVRGLADDLRLDVWLMGYMMPVEREFVRPDFVRLGTGLACAEMIRSGTTCFADMYYFEEEVAEATAAAGLRAFCGRRS